MQRTWKFQDLQCYEWTVGPSTFQAIPELGARLLSWDISLGKNKKRAVIHWPDSANLSSLPIVHGGNPILFPFCGRTYCDGEINFWRNPEGVRLPIPMHGFARDSHFVLESVHRHGFTAELASSPTNRAFYPYGFLFRVTYEFRDLSLEVRLELTNLHSSPIPWSAGHHFYFRLPWHEGAAREFYRIVLPAKKAYRQADDGSLFPDPTYLFDKLNPSTSFGEPQLSDRIHTHLYSQEIRFGPRSGDQDIRILIGDSPRPAPHITVVTWSESETVPYYCVEPWMGPPNGSTHKLGLHFVPPGQTDVFKVTITLE